MAYAEGSRTLTKVGIVGSGQIGPDIALHMTKVLHEHRVPVIVVDIAVQALEAGRSKLEKKVGKGVETGAFKTEQADAMKANVTFTQDYDALRGASLVIEAATEDLDLKRRIFAQLEDLAAADAVLASNSSHLEPERIFSELRDPSRTAVIHYFFPAERNPLVEIVPGARTDRALIDWLLRFYEAIGKVVIGVKSRYGYAVDPIFEGIFQAAALCVEEGLGTTKEVDASARRALGLGVGPFTAMNLTGGNPITAHGLDGLHTRVHPWFQAPRILRDALKEGRPWEVPGRGETVAVAPEAEEKIIERMQGAYFGLVGEVLDSGITNVADLDMAVQTGLVIRAPFQFMNELGPMRALELVRGYRKVQEPFPVPECLVRQAASGKPWEIAHVLRRDEEGIAVLTIRRPQVLNALNQEVYAQLDRHLAAIAEDPSVEAVVITGYGRKAFVSGADISMLAAIQSPEEGERLSRSSHAVMNRIEAMPKPVLCAYNGLAFGGGNELGLACHGRIARKGLKILAAQPEPNLGIIPGAGATQRLPRLVGLDKAWALLRTGRPISGAEALELGLIREEVEGDVVAAAVALARDAARGKVELPRIATDPMVPPGELPEVDLGHLSRAVDAVLQKTILEGMRMSLPDGLALESRRFGEVCRLEDMRIGVENFIKNGPRAKARFVHR
ncbi:MAG: 3-hydroxyacyl-CoA dehydrogenase/enoyl-CoA hydratase family protein [Acidobacteriota bacterium]